MAISISSFAQYFFGIVNRLELYSVENLSKIVKRTAKILGVKIDEQAAIATVLTDMDTEIASLEAKKEKFELIKKGMMQELLTGRVRLV